MKRSRLPAILTVLVLVFLNSPLVVLVLNSFNASRFGGSWEGFTWQWYERLWQAEAVWDAFFLSLCLAFASTLAATLLGTLAAWSLHRHRSHLQNLHRCLLVLPLALPELLMGMALLSLFTALHIPTGPLTIWAAHITFSISYVAMVVLGRLRGFDPLLLDAARDLGASPWQAARRVVLPLLLPGILAGALLAFTLSMDDFVITFFVAGPGSTTLPLRIASMMKTSRSLPVINALSSLLLCATFLAAALSLRLGRQPSAPP
jgi:spermidine/putrescine transport system permease protein